MKDQLSMPQRTKDPEERKVYGWDWTEDLEAGESISSSAWSIETTEASSDLEVDPGSETIDGAKTSVRLTGGTKGVLYKVKNLVTTAPSGDVGVRRFELRITPK